MVDNMRPVDVRWYLDVEWFGGAYSRARRFKSRAIPRHHSLTSPPGANRTASCISMIWRSAPMSRAMSHRHGDVVEPADDPTFGTERLVLADDHVPRGDRVAALDRLHHHH